MDQTLENVKAILNFFAACGTPEEQEFCKGLLVDIDKDDEKEVEKLIESFSRKQ